MCGFVLLLAVMAITRQRATRAAADSALIRTFSRVWGGVAGLRAAGLRGEASERRAWGRGRELAPLFAGLQAAFSGWLAKKGNFASARKPRGDEAQERERSVLCF